MYRLRRQIFRQIFRQIEQKPRRNPDGFQVGFVRYGGKYASKLCIKAYAVIDSEVPYFSLWAATAKKPPRLSSKYVETK